MRTSFGRSSPFGSALRRRQWLGRPCAFRRLCDQLQQLHPERHGQLLDQSDRRIKNAALKAGQRREIDVGAIGQFFHCKILLDPDSPDIPANDAACLHSVTATPCFSLRQGIKSQ